MRDIKSRRRMTLLKEESVRPGTCELGLKMKLWRGRMVLTGQETVELHEQLEVHIVTLGRLSVSAADMMSVEIDTYSQNPIVSL